MSMQMERAKGTPEQQIRLAAFNVKSAVLTKARGTTRDRAEKDRIRAERKQVLAEADQVQAEIMAGIQASLASGSGVQSTQDLNESLPARELTIRIQVNGDTRLPDQAVACRVEGSQPSFEQADGCADFGTHCTTLHRGPFEMVKKVSGDTNRNQRETDLGLPTKARGFVFTYAGLKDRPDAVRGFMRQTDLTTIRALLPWPAFCMSALLRHWVHTRRQRRASRA